LLLENEVQNELHASGGIQVLVRKLNEERIIKDNARAQECLESFCLCVLTFTLQLKLTLILAKNVNIINIF
jgi:hypothetical protein